MHKEIFSKDTYLNSNDTFLVRANQKFFDNGDLEVFGELTLYLEHEGSVKGSITCNDQIKGLEKLLNCNDSDIVEISGIGSVQNLGVTISIGIFDVNHLSQINVILPITIKTLYDILEKHLRDLQNISQSIRYIKHSYLCSPKEAPKNL